MTKLYTARLPTTLSFLSSEPPAGVDLTEYQELSLNVRGVPTLLCAEKNYLTNINIKSKDILPENWLKQLVYDSIETQGDYLVYTLISSDQSDEFTAEEINTRIEVLTQVGHAVNDGNI